MLSHLECQRCGVTHDASRPQNRCDCGGTLLVRYAPVEASVEDLRARPGGMWRYRELLPVERDPFGLGAAETPLVAAPRISESVGKEVFIKDDGLLPSSTFKARGAAFGIGRALELGITRIVLPSAGNAGAAWSLYGARAGIDIHVVMARSSPPTNHAEVRAAGGRLELVDGTIAVANSRAREIASQSDEFLAATFSEPYRLEGKKSAWFEVFDALGDGSSMRLPGTIVMPVGGGVAAVAAAKAAREAIDAGWGTGEPPMLIGVQPDTCAPLVEAFEKGRSDFDPWPGEPLTIAAGLRVPDPAEGRLVLDTIRSSKGTMVAVSEDEIVAAVGRVTARAGVFCCPEGAASAAALDRLDVGSLPPGPVVLYNTGSGAKYLDALTAAGLSGPD